MKAYRTDFVAAERDLEESRKSRVSQNTSNGYANFQARFVQWLSVNRPAQLNREWVKLIYEEVKGSPLLIDADIPELDDSFKMALKEKLLDYDRALSPLNFETFSVADVLVYFQQLKVQAKSKSSHRSAIRALFEHYGRDIPEDWERETKEVFAGMKRREAQSRQDGVLVLPGGKRHRRGGKLPLTEQMYATLMQLMYRKQISPYKMLFTNLMWNLMSRASSVDNICLNHIDWTGDAMTILFCHMKNNQTGEGKGMHARHIYANPLRPELCGVLALGLFIFTSPARSDSARLFHSNREYSRVLKAMRETFDDNESELFAQLGLKAQEWALHSFRKGAASYASNGPCAVQKSVSDNRGGWTQGGQADTYYGYVPEGDQLIGRILAMLPMTSVDFCILPPTFKDGLLRKEVTDALEILCPSYLRREDAEEEADENRVFIQPRVLSYCLASVVYHAQWLQDNVPRNHPLRSTALFTDAAFLQRLRELVVCKQADPLDIMQPTGVPPAIMHLRSIETAKQEIKSLAEMLQQQSDKSKGEADRVIAVLGEKVDNLPDVILEGLDVRQVESTLTPTGMRNIANEVMESSALSHKLDHLVAALALMSAPAQQPVANAPPPAAPEAVPMKTYMWGGKPRLLPADFVIPTENHTPNLMWNLYISGNAAAGTPPLKDVAATNCPRGCYKRYCEFLQLMKLIRAEVEAKGAWEDASTSEAAARMFEVAKHVLKLPAKGPKGYAIRPEQKAWATVWKELQKKNRGKKKAPKGKKQPRNRDQDSDDGSDDGSEESNDVSQQTDSEVVSDASDEPLKRPVGAARVLDRRAPAARPPARKRIGRSN